MLTEELLYLEGAFDANGPFFAGEQFRCIAPPFPPKQHTVAHPRLVLHPHVATLTAHVSSVSICSVAGRASVRACAAWPQLGHGTDCAGVCSLVDAALLPWFLRMYILKHYRQALEASSHITVAQLR